MGCPCSFSPLRLLFQGSQRSLSWWRQSEAQGFHPDGGIRGSGDGGSTPATTRDSRKHPSSVDVVALYVIDILYTLAEMLIQHDSTLFHLEFRKAFKIHTLGGATILEGEHSPYSRQLFLLVKDEIFTISRRFFGQMRIIPCEPPQKLGLPETCQGRTLGFKKIYKQEVSHG